MTDAPERLWLIRFTKSQYGARLGHGTVSDLDHGQNPVYPEYVRKDLCTNLEDERDALLAERDALVDEVDGAAAIISAERAEVLKMRDQLAKVEEALHEIQAGDMSPYEAIDMIRALAEQEKRA